MLGKIKDRPLLKDKAHPWKVFTGKLPRSKGNMLLNKVAPSPTSEAACRWKNSSESSAECMKLLPPTSSVNILVI